MNKLLKMNKLEREIHNLYIYACDSSRYMSCFEIPEWRHIQLNKVQRNKLSRVNVQERVKSWDATKTPPIERVWQLKTAMMVKTLKQQKEDTRKKVLDIPQGVLCMLPPDEAVPLLRPTNVAFDSLFADTQRSAAKFEAYMYPVCKTKRQYVKDRRAIGYTKFNSCTSEEYAKHGRCATPKQLREFLKSEPEFAVIDEFISIYMKRIAQYFCGAAHATPHDLARVEQIVNDQADMSLLKYEDQGGIFQHIDHIMRSDAITFTIGVGRDVTYDMSRALGRDPHEPVTIIRSHNPEGSMIVLQDEARYKWTHGVPHSSQPNGTKYTIHICLFHNTGLTEVTGRCEELGTDMHGPATHIRCAELDAPMHSAHHTLSNLLTQLQNTRIAGPMPVHLPDLQNTRIAGPMPVHLPDLQNTRIASTMPVHIPDRIRRPGLPRVHPRPGWI